jgi:hypothetical protein
MKVTKISTYYKEFVNVIIETPRGCQNKFDFDPKLSVFTLSKTLDSHESYRRGKNFVTFLFLLFQSQSGSKAKAAGADGFIESLPR